MDAIDRLLGQDLDEHAEADVDLREVSRVHAHPAAVAFQPDHLFRGPEARVSASQAQADMVDPLRVIAQEVGIDASRPRVLLQWRETDKFPLHSICQRTGVPGRARDELSSR